MKSLSIFDFATPNYALTEIGKLGTDTTLCLSVSLHVKRKSFCTHFHLQRVLPHI